MLKGTLLLLSLLAVTSLAAADPGTAASPSLEALRAAIFAPAAEIQQTPAPQWAATCSASVVGPHQGGTITCSGISGCLETTCLVSCFNGTSRVTKHCPSPCIEQ